MLVMGNCCISTPPINNTEKKGFHGDRIGTIATTSAGDNGGRYKKDTKHSQYSTRMSDFYHKNFDDDEG